MEMALSEKNFGLLGQQKILDPSRILTAICMSVTITPTKIPGWGRVFLSYNLESLNRKIFNRKRNIVLLLDNASAHEAAVRELGGERGSPTSEYFSD